ncbi:MAG: hypothetical protein JNJ70_23730 [Verrucomicrobiales bacterium]|nr:hypothetical protein [Verrucomicrobiales bacterium]
MNFDNSSTELHPAIGTITLTKQAGASAWTGTISFSCYSFWGQPYQVLNATGGGAITFTQAQSQQFLWWQNVINDWKSDNASLGAAIKQLKADHSQKMWEYARIGFDSPPDFDDVYEIRYAPPTKLYPGGRKKAIITKRGSGRSALVRLNQAFLTLSDAWSKVKIGGNLSLDLANGSLKNSTLTSIGLESYEIPDDVLGVAATISKLAIYEGKAYKPISAIKRDIASYNRSKQSAANALRLMRSNIDRVGSLTSKIVEGLEKEAVAFRTNIETDTLLTNDEKDELKGLLLVRLLELTGI